MLTASCASEAVTARDVSTVLGLIGRDLQFDIAETVAREDLAGAFGVHVAVGIDARDGFVAVKGWTEKTGLTAVEFGRQVSALGVKHIIFTDVSTDGMLTGPNYAATTGMCEAVSSFVIASGGVGEVAHIRRLQELASRHKNLTGVIVGKALYDGRVNLREVA